MTTSNTTTEKREALKVWNADRLIRIGKMDSVADYMEMLDNMSASKINKEYNNSINYKMTGIFA